MGQTRQHRRTRQSNPQLALQSSDDILGFVSLGTYEEGFDLVHFPFLGLGSRG
eukprot:CAMPEP_0201673076 /NCGR_PEP_ID=MMETSP0494-20130426/33797_1 /ASSEMBLY_ACC=CAM_ASM_000839 /TAXON_ID=420259 /ORGANISM="Thalassiosira gravida, Strain GMp14c1" /LENGTH=52 /DNA_ID=CAMNT_0048154895 /DNA_START=129 /DNA_END=283 /DNA_ORIENTATION=+